MTRPVFFAEDALSDAGALSDRTVLARVSVGTHVRLRGAEGRHAGTVKRLGESESVDLVDGDGFRLVCQVISSDKNGLDLRVNETIAEQPPLVPLTLVQALSKGGRDELAVEVCTEIGVDQVIPWQSNRAIVRWSGPKRDKGHDKWRSVVRSAAKQARRARIPRVGQVCDSAELTRWVRSFIDEGGAVVMCHEEATLPLTQVVADIAVRDADTGDSGVFRGGIAVIVGPEGGIDPQESADLEAAGAIKVLLGTNVLRASTAGAVAMTLIGAHAGRFD
ncbi:16S rRNA (uracil(1498)-N(3))-methyltransferase [Schaalia sp. ZJ405]|uniref:16S rRNA (uracil(1498)-N(3))-methyltransferase n=1 Tax=Schaalia sp. ZJ405 TaxID=2709403 RepID=UPI0013EB553D|nr:16S rRNA (uracil(1498)-N(3))-methyltransferase [Schaalia sp. ZJ405]QPK80632.1 16S rRNA (uracil(1498)-N(3))-methyltransferase [Schaalia sp. ZJ405]